MNQHIYSVVASRRRRLGLSQQELAARAGLRREKVNRFESKGEDISLQELSRLLDALGLQLRVHEKAEARSSSSAPHSHHSRRLAPRDFHEASFIDGSKAKVLNWGKLPR